MDLAVSTGMGRKGSGKKREEGMTGFLGDFWWIWGVSGWIFGVGEES